MNEHLILALLPVAVVAAPAAAIRLAGTVLRALDWDRE